MCTFLFFFVCGHSFHPTSYFLLLHFSPLSPLTSYLIKIYLILLVVCYFFVLLHAQIIIANKKI